MYKSIPLVLAVIFHCLKNEIVRKEFLAEIEIFLPFLLNCCLTQHKSFIYRKKLDCCCIKHVWYLSHTFGIFIDTSRIVSFHVYLQSLCHWRDSVRSTWGNSAENLQYWARKNKKRMKFLFKNVIPHYFPASVSTFWPVAYRTRAKSKIYMRLTFKHEIHAKFIYCARIHVFGGFFRLQTSLFVH